MTDPARFEARLTPGEADASTALRLARAHERDIAELPIKVDANRRAINALGVQTAERFTQLERRVDHLERKVDGRFTRVEARFDRIDAQFQHIDAEFRHVDTRFGLVARAFADIRGRLDGTAAGLEQIVRMLTPREPGDGAPSET